MYLRGAALTVFWPLCQLFPPPKGSYVHTCTSYAEFFDSCLASTGLDSSNCPITLYLVPWILDAVGGFIQRGRPGEGGARWGLEAAVFETWMTIWIGAIDYYFYYCHVVLCQEGINTWISRKWWQELPLPLQLPPSSQRPPQFTWSKIMDHMETPNIRVEELQTCHDSCGLPVDLPSKVQQGDTFVRGQYVVQIVSNETELELRLKINQLSTPCTDQVTPTRT